MTNLVWSYNKIKGDIIPENIFYCINPFKKRKADKETVRAAGGEKTIIKSFSVPHAIAFLVKAKKRDEYNIYFFRRNKCTPDRFRDSILAYNKLFRIFIQVMEHVIGLKIRYR